MTKKKESDKTLRVLRIKDGIVIDHITSGKSPEVLKILGIDEDFHNTITIAMNVPSSIHGKKDIVKVERRQLNPTEINQIALIAPHATINKVKNYKVIGKETVELPDKIIGSLKCPNPNCITNKEREPALSIFLVKQKSPLVLTCKYCERSLT